MDTNGDGIVDDPLATPVKKKVGRKSLGLTPAEMKAHREVLRKKRLEAKRRKEKYNLLEELIWEAIDKYESTTIKAHAELKNVDDAMAVAKATMSSWIDELADDKTLIIKRDTKVTLAGYNGERLRRSND